MRVDKIPPRHVYENFGDWVFSHPIWLINIVIGAIVYLYTTEEV